MIIRGFFAVMVLAAASQVSGCGSVVNESNDSRQAAIQEKNIQEAHRQVAPPAIVNWNELRIAKLIQEKRDQVNLSTFTYTKNQMDGKYTFVCESIGYGLPYNTRTNNPEHYEFNVTPEGATNMGGYYQDNNGSYVWGTHEKMPQPEPNGLFIPDSAKGTWNLCRDPVSGKPDVTYQEEDIAVFPYRLPAEMVEGFHPAPLPDEKKPDIPVPTVNQKR